MEKAPESTARERGYIVHPVERMRGGRTELGFIGRMENGETFAIVETRRRPFFSLREEDIVRAGLILKRAGLSVDVGQSERRTMDGSATSLLFAPTSAEARRIRDLLHHEGVRTYEADVKLTAQHLMDFRVRGTVEIGGAWRPGRRVARIYENPELVPATFTPRLSILSLDIETDSKAQTVYAVALAFRRWDANPVQSEILFNGAGAAEARCFPAEKEMLQELRARILALDPDIITGWNVIDFDFRVLAGRFSALGIPFDIGRSDSPARFLDRTGTADDGARWKRSRAIVEGRQVIDGLWLARMAGLALEDYRLETVARALLGRGKRIELLPGESGTHAVERLYLTEPSSLTAYCLEDARLVLEILDKEGLMDLAVAKSLMIGTPLDQTWASVACFELLYMEHLHARGLVAPTLGIDQQPLDRSPGGGIITPRAGLYENVLVFDFKSLYPSLMRTFNIDPLTHKPHGKTDDEGALITAPNGEHFRREPGILPEILNRFFESRENARREGNRAASYAYKIVMNSFYGVLGTDGCRFASSALAGTITTLGQHILFWARDRVRAMGYEVIYGDTDSLFVISGLPRETGSEALDEAGAALCRTVNAELAVYARETYGVQSRLELEFEGCYRRFFLPPMRTMISNADDDRPVGRAKGYAGLRAGRGSDTRETLEIVGMEAVRHDWTELAQELQRNLLHWVFHDVPASDIEERIRLLLKEVREGKKDDKLVYRKLLRKPVEAYTKSSPPHARAAALLPREERSGLIRYVWTRDGPQPESRLSSPPDYAHYVDKQMLPIVEAVAPYAGLDMNRIFSAGGQLELF
jgi:DNA polymerase-2